MALTKIALNFFPSLFWFLTALAENLSPTEDPNFSTVFNSLIETLSWSKEGGIHSFLFTEELIFSQKKLKLFSLYVCFSIRVL